MTRRLVIALVLLAAACGKKDNSSSQPPDDKGGMTPVDAAGGAAKTPPVEVKIPPAPPLAPTPVGLPDMKSPDTNALTAEKAMLGKQLFFDKRLSKDGSAACETCHHHDMGWTDGLPLSTKVGGKVNTRHTPTLYNTGYLVNGLYWDGRAKTIEDQVKAAWKGQMGAEDQAGVATALAGIPMYKAEFNKVFGADPTADTVIQAVAAFVRTLQSGDAPWDRYEKGDKTAVTEDAIAGYKLFTTKAQCSLCHAPPFYFDTLYHNVGIGMDKPEPDLGKGGVGDKKPEDKGAFKTPGLRSVTKSGPYFHDGSEATLEGAVKFMLAGGTANPDLDKRLKPIKLTDKEFAQLMEFLKSLESTETFENPELPASTP